MAIINIKAKPYDFKFDPKSVALVIIDFQRDFLLNGGYGETLGNNPLDLQKAIEPTKKVLNAFREYKLPIFHTREGHKPDLSDCPSSKINRGTSTLKIGDNGPMGRILIRGEYGHEIIKKLAPIKGESIIDKSGKGAFYNTDLDKQLKKRKIKYLIFTGVTTEVCVQSTIREANDRGYECLLLDDCVASYKSELHNAAIKMIISQGGIFGWVTNSNEFLKVLKSSLN